MGKECRRVEGLLAASMYEPLSGSEREQLEAHLDDCAVCRETLRGFESLMHEVPVDQPVLGVDLLPSIREELGDEAPGRVVRFRRYAAACAAAAAAVLVALGGGYAAMNADAPAPAIAQDEPARRASQLDRTFKQVEALMEARFHSRAFLVLDGAAKRHPNDARAPEALQLAAHLALDELEWYPEAHGAFRSLREKHTEHFEADDSNRIALEMLEESYGPNGDYLPLRLLHQARVNGDFDGYERVLSQYPGTYIAARALDEMTHALAQEGDVVVALETLAESCTHPVAIAQVKLKLARTLDQNGASADRVRNLYQEAATSESVALARAAQDALRELER